MDASIEAVVGPVAAAIVIISLACMLGFRSNRRFSDESDVLALTMPHGGAREFLQDSRGCAVFALLNDGRFLAAKVMGNQIVTRVFARSTIRSVKIQRLQRKKSARFILKFEDFGFPSLHLETKDEEPPAWLSSLQTGGKPQWPQ